MSTPFQGGTDKLVNQMKDEMIKNGVDIRIRSNVEKIEVGPDRRLSGVVVNGRRIGCAAILSNANHKKTIFALIGSDNHDKDYVEEAEAVRLNTSSCQVYIALKPGESFDHCGDLLFHSEHKGFDIDAILSREISSRTFSFYYPETRPGHDRYVIVSSTNARFEDWASLSPEDYEASKQDLAETTLDCLEQYVPNIREKVDHAEASTPKTFQHYTKHWRGSSFEPNSKVSTSAESCPNRSADCSTQARSESSCPGGWERLTTESSFQTTSTNT